MLWLAQSLRQEAVGMVIRHERLRILRVRMSVSFGGGDAKIRDEEIEIVYVVVTLWILM